MDNRETAFLRFWGLSVVGQAPAAAAAACFYFFAHPAPAVELAVTVTAMAAGAAFSARALRGGLDGFLRAEELMRRFFDDGLVGSLPSGRPGASGRMMDHASRAVSRLEYLGRRHDNLTTRDSLTGLFNQAFIMEMLAQDRDRAARSEIRVCVVVFHLDQLAIVLRNGEADAEAALRHVATSLRKHMNDSDWLGRWDGGAFVGLMWNVDTAEAREACSRIQDQLGDDLMIRNGRTYSLSVSSGVICPSPDESTAQLLERVRASIDAVRDRGRNSVTIL